MRHVTPFAVLYHFYCKFAFLGLDLYGVAFFGSSQFNQLHAYVSRCASRFIFQ